MGQARGAAWGDYDNDGNLDIYIANEGPPNVLYRNNGDGTFTNVARQAGVADINDGGGVAFGDYDDDGDLDLCVANLFGAPNVLYRNNGDGTFTDVTAFAGVGDSGNGHGVVFADYDNDLDMDILLINQGEANVLYRNNGDGTFTDISREAGIVGPGPTRGVAVGDLDNDGDLDIYMANTNRANILYSNNGDGTFSDITLNAGVGDTGGGLGVALGDYDNDNDLDIYVVNWDHQANFLYRNNGNEDNWLQVKTVGTVSNKAAIGTRVKVIAGELAQMREVSGGSGFCSQDSLPVEFGLGKRAKADRIEIRWPSGIVQTLTDVPANQTLTVTEEISAHDITVTAIIAPDDVVEPMKSVTPQVHLRNVGANDEGNIAVTCEITAGDESVYSDTQTLEKIASLKGDYLRFAEWTPLAGVQYDVKVTVNLPDDANQKNNRLTKTVTPFLFSNATEGAGFADAMGGGCAAVGDYDGDDDLDLYTGRLYRNTGDNTFSDVTASAGIASIADPSSAYFGDLDGDKDLDLIAADGGQTRLYRNNGDGTFTAITAETGETLSEGGRALALADYDRDGHLDIYIARIGANRLYRNNGDGRFTDMTGTAGVGDTSWSEAAAFGDYNGDGPPDLYVANWGATNRLYRNNGDGTFTEVSDEAGIGHPGSAQDAVFCDYNGDGNLDLFVSNGENQPDTLYRNNGDGSFTDVTMDAGLGGETWAEAVTCEDYDGDGDIDLYLVVSSGPNQLYRNNGDGSFSRAGRAAGVDASGVGAAASFFDLDGDSDLDLFVANREGLNALYRNTMRRSAQHRKVPKVN